MIVAEKRRTRARRPKFDDRTRFNWGYHDAAQDVLNPKFTERDLVNELDPKRPAWQQVSKMKDYAYYYGYREGLDDARAGLYAKNSQEAWDRTSKHPSVLILRDTARY
jgi:hypothetical protein